jgi:uncharacterized protein (TIGR02145 family)
MSVRILAVCVAMGIAFGFAGPRSKRMGDGKLWMTENLNVAAGGSYCYQDAEANCLKYGRLYTWESARRACESLGGGWRLPTDDEWRGLAKQYGGMHDDAPDGGKAAYLALLAGGRSGFGAVLGGDRDGKGEYARLEAHGFYWTATERDSATARYYNFGHGSTALYRQTDGEKEMAIAVRCVR